MKAGSRMDVSENALLKEGCTSMFRMQGNSMYPFLQEGDMGIIQRCDPDQLRVGDIVVFGTNKHWIAHRLIRIEYKDGTTIFITKGDNNKFEDAPFTVETLVGQLSHFTRGTKVFSSMGVYFRLGAWFNTLFGALLTPCYHLGVRMTAYRISIRQECTSLMNNLRIISLPVRKQFIVNACLSFIQSILPFLLILCVKVLIDRLTHPAGISLPWLNQTWLVAATALVFLLNGILSAMQGYFSEKLSHAITCHTYRLLHQKHLELDLCYYEDPKQQDKMFRAVQEAGYRPVKIINELLTLLKSLIAAFVMLILVLSVKWYLLILLLLSVMPSIFIHVRYTRLRYRMKASQSGKEREMAYFNRILTGIPFAKELRLFDFSCFFLERFRHIETTLFQEKQQLHKSEMHADIATQIFAVLLIFISFASVVWLMGRGTISIGSVVLFFFVFQRGYSVLGDLLRSITFLLEDNTYLNDFFAFLHLPSQEPNIAKEQIAPLQKGITVENLRFRYESSQRDALEAVSLQIPAGKTVALVGANGSGKTTLVKLLCGFHTPQEGCIRYDGLNINSLDKKELRRQITCVFQDYALYNITACDNIGLGDVMKPVDREKVRQAALAADIAELIEQLPAGYETLLGTLFQSGEELSIGQWQKIAIARAIYRDSPILLMDEPSSALDTESEQQLLEYLRRLSRNKTTVIISHRLATVQWADIIYVLDKGRIVESGNHQSLMELRGKYHDMYLAGREASPG